MMNKHLAIIGSKAAPERYKKIPYFIILRPGSLEYFLVNPNHSVKIVSHA
jgi:hypothetical protein